jgi:hypothetical protein
VNTDAYSISLKQTKINNLLQESTSVTMFDITAQGWSKVQVIRTVAQDNYLYDVLRHHLQNWKYGSAVCRQFTKSSKNDY